MTHTDPELVAFAQRLNGTYKEEDGILILQELAALENQIQQAEFEAMQEANDLHRAQQAAQDDCLLFDDSLSSL